VTSPQQSAPEPHGRYEGRLLEGKVAIVTGVGPGMGRSIAMRFAQHGARVVLGARRIERIEDVSDEIRQLGGEALALACDIADPASCETFVGRAAEHYGRLDIVVQNAHHEGDWTAAASADLAQWKHIMDINFFGALRLVQQAVPVMTSAGSAGSGGSIVLVNSGAAVSFPATMGAYSTSKAALAGLTRTLAKELGPNRIRVNGIFLGPVAGENLFRLGQRAASAAGSTLDAWTQAKAGELPLGSLPTPDECAGSVLFLASHLSAPVTGQHLSVNGGQWVS
jgi:NAD(P)-dependent dehydrogenase (short-subunit alcohol dehydrogenase family)